MRYRSPAKNTQKTSELPGKITAYLKENPGARMYNIVEAAKASDRKSTRLNSSHVT